MTTGKRSLALHIYAILTAVSAVLLIVAGALVTSTESGDAVPDWPLSYGQLNPPMVGGIFYEHGHRVFAFGVGLLVLGLAIWLTLRDRRKEVVRLGWISVLAVVLQAVIGGVRVLVVSHDTLQSTALNFTGHAHVEPVRIWFATAHALVAQLIICMLFAIAAFTSPRWGTQRAVSNQGLARSGAKVGAFLMGAVILQLIVGGMMRHSGAGLIVPDFPLVYGQVIPQGNLHNLLLEYNRKYETNLIGRAYHQNQLDKMTRAEVDFKVGIHVTHRVWAFVILGVLLWNWARIKKAVDAPAHLKRQAALLGWLGLVQVSLGISVILTKKSVDLTVAHVATGATLLGMLTIYTLAWSALKERAAEKAPALKKAGVTA